MVHLKKKKKKKEREREKDKCSGLSSPSNIDSLINLFNRHLLCFLLSRLDIKKKKKNKAQFLPSEYLFTKFFKVSDCKYFRFISQVISVAATQLYSTKEPISICK